MKIDPTRLADALSGTAEKDSAGAKLFQEASSRARLPEILWHLQHLSKTPGQLDALSDAIGAGLKAKDDSYYDTSDQIRATLRFLSEGIEEFHAGRFDIAFMGQIEKRMEAHAATVRATLADTKVSKLVLKELDLALRHKVPVPIIGDSRFGKTKAMSVWCEMYPGLRRMVTVPESNRDWDFFAAHADAFGLDYSHRTTLQHLKRAVEWVVQVSRAFVCYDESHYLVPVNYHAGTPPKRINWIRAHVIDKGIGCAFFATPQSLDQSLEKYASKTKYNLEQWIGRLAPAIVLADYYDRDELMAVAKVHFPKFPEKLLALICSRAMQSEGYLKSMEHAARYASALAEDRVHRQPTMQDVDDAIARMMPGKTPPAAVTSEAGKPSHKRGIKSPLTTVSRPITNGGSDEETPLNFRRQRTGQGDDSESASARIARGDLVAV